MTATIKDILDTRITILNSHIAEDSEWLNDNFLGYFMKGRIYIEEMWLEETKSLYEKDLPIDALIDILTERRAILKTYTTEQMSRYNTTDGQEMRGRTVITTHWLEETEQLIKMLETIGGK